MMTGPVPVSRSPARRGWGTRALGMFEPRTKQAGRDTPTRENRQQKCGVRLATIASTPPMVAVVAVGEKHVHKQSSLLPKLKRNLSPPGVTC